MAMTTDTFRSNDYYGDGTLAKAYMENFKAGRTHEQECSSTADRMPNPEDGCDGLSSIFIDNIFANQGGREWEFTAAISGAHTLGSATVANLGYDGFWGSADE